MNVLFLTSALMASAAGSPGSQDRDLECVVGDDRYVRVDGTWTHHGVRSEPTPLKKGAIARSSPTPEVDSETQAWREELQVTLDGVSKTFTSMCHYEQAGVFVRPVDLDTWYAHDRPGPGTTRCRSRDDTVGWLTTTYAGGPAPYPGLVVSTSTVVKDGQVVAETIRRAEVRSTEGVDLKVTSSDPTPVKTNDPHHHRWTARYTFRRSDGQPLRPGLDALEATLTCERYDHPPAP